MKAVMLFLALLPIPIVAFILIGARWQYKARVGRALAKAFPDKWRAMLRADFPFYGRLDDRSREHLERNIRIFLATKSFEGCGGLEVTEAMRVLVAAQACLLLLNRDVPCYPLLNTILIYPSACVDVGNQPFGSVALSWDNVTPGAMNVHDGQSVALQESAHRPDQGEVVADGAPGLVHRGGYASWARVLSKDYERHRRRSKQGRAPVMGDHDATGPAEFFAAATETFFEKPAQMKKKWPGLFKELESYYGVDPEEWQKKTDK